MGVSTNPIISVSCFSPGLKPAPASPRPEPFTYTNNVRFIEKNQILRSCSLQYAAIYSIICGKMGRNRILSGAENVSALTEEQVRLFKIKHVMIDRFSHRYLWLRP